MVLRWLVALAGLGARRVAAEDRAVHRPAFYWSEDNSKIYLNVYWSKKLNQKKDDEDSLFGESGFVKPMDEVEVFFDTQHLEVFAYNLEEGYHLDLPLRNRIVIKWSLWENREDGTGIDITMKKTRIGRCAMQVAVENQMRYNVFDSIQNQELRNWLETYPYHCLACNAIFDEVFPAQCPRKKRRAKQRAHV
jgi:hypothetical protein